MLDSLAQRTQSACLGSCCGKNLYRNKQDSLKNAELESMRKGKWSCSIATRSESLRFLKNEVFWLIWFTTQGYVDCKATFMEAKPL